MATQNKSRQIEVNISTQDLIFQETTIPGVNEETSRDIARNHKAVTAKTSNPFVSEGNHGTKIIPQEIRHKLADKWTRQPSYKI